MTPEQKAAYVMAQAACMLAELEAMKVENSVREMHANAPAYGPDAFHALIDKYGIGHNTVLGLFNP